MFSGCNANDLFNIQVTYVLLVYDFVLLRATWELKV